MTRKDILKKYGFSWMSNVNLNQVVPYMNKEIAKMKAGEK